MNLIDNVVSICQPPRTFSLEEANSLVPIFIRITRRHESGIEYLLSKQRFLVQTGAKAEIYNKLDPEVGKHMVQWGQKLFKLGARVFDNGFIGLYAGNGCYWSWHFGEEKIEYWHTYSESPLYRKPILVTK